MHVEPRTFFITGATGYLGSGITQALIDAGHTVFCLKRTSSQLKRLLHIAPAIAWVDLETLDPLHFFKNHRVDAIIHCATDYGRKIVDPIQTIEANLILPLKLLHAAAINAVPTFINTDTILDKGINNYALSKSQFNEWLQQYSQKITCINLALQHFYGPGDDDTKFVTFIIKALLEKQARIELTAGEQERDFIHIHDVLDAFLRIIHASQALERGYHRFEIGSGHPIRIKDFVTLVRQISSNHETHLEFGAIPYRKGETMKTSTDITGITALGWKPSLSLSEGLQQTITAEIRARQP